MNERIIELAKQAGFETQTAKLKIYKNDDGTVISGGWEYPIEKFAELIVRECADIADQPTSRPFRDYGEKIKHHFGVSK